MENDTLTIILLLVGLGAYIQTVSGFALGLLVMGSVTATGLAPVSFTAVIVSFAALANVILALARDHETVDWRLTVLACLGLLPGIVLGVGILDALDRTSEQALRVALGLFILAGGLLMMLRPQPRSSASAPWWTSGIGALAGIFGGLFSTAGPPLVFHFYRQPMAVPVIRTTLLAIFGVGTSMRILYVAAQGNMTAEMFRASALAVPVVVGGTLLARRFQPPLSDLSMRRLAFALLALLGMGLLLASE